MKLRFPVKDINSLAGRYSYARREAELVSLHGLIKAQQFLTLKQLGVLAHWKSPRSARNVSKNSDSFVREMTSFALRTPDERSRIESLTVLGGVKWPTASVILHLFHGDQYPILDYRALWSVTAKKPSLYTFTFWSKYVTFCRAVANETRVSMRTLDRALWQYSKENQP